MPIEDPNFQNGAPTLAGGPQDLQQGPGGQGFGSGPQQQFQAQGDYGNAWGAQDAGGGTNSMTIGPGQGMGQEPGGNTPAPGGQWGGLSQAQIESALSGGGPGLYGGLWKALNPEQQGQWNQSQRDIQNQLGSAGGGGEQDNAARRQAMADSLGFNLNQTGTPGGQDSQWSAPAAAPPQMGQPSSPGNVGGLNLEPQYAAAPSGTNPAPGQAPLGPGNQFTGGQF